MSVDDKPDYKSLFSNFEEVEVAVECNVKGTIPSYLNGGTLLRNGPGLFTIGDTCYRHWFDGLSYIQRYAFIDGIMTYQAKLLKSNTYLKNKAANRIVVSEFGTSAFSDPCKNMFRKFFNLFTPEPMTDNCLVNFLKAGDKVYATTETPMLREIDVHSIETKELVDLTKVIALHSNTAHHHYDKAGNIYNIGSSFGKDSFFVFTKTQNPSHNDDTLFNNGLNSIEVIGKVAIKDKLKPAYYHSFGMTENYMILIESPLRLGVMAILGKRITGKSYRDTFEWLPSTINKIHVMDKRNGKVLDLSIETSEAFFTFHHANAYEKDSYIVVDYCSMDEPGTLDNFQLDLMREGNVTEVGDGFRSFLHRMIIPTQISPEAKAGDDLLKYYPDKSHRCRATLSVDGKVIIRPQLKCELPFEFPQFNYDYCGQFYKYVYGSVLQKNELNKDGIVKVNLVDGSFISWKKDKESFITTEPIFVKNPVGKDEDDGCLVVPIITNLSIGDKCFVLILDARNLEELARCYVPMQLPMGFHAMFVGKEFGK
uniref:Beta,beta-carotene 15,15'-monooxygenase n=1 Tax=Rhabditophanes sp. KR3021 TaxID=114890 RepID=A0AC35TG86_9BILA